MGDFDTDVTRETHQQVQKPKQKVKRMLSKKMRNKKKSGIFKINLNKGNFEENDKLIKSFTANDLELQESLNEISGMDLTSPNVYQTNQEEEKGVESGKDIYKTVQEESVDKGDFIPEKKATFKTTRHKVITRKREKRKVSEMKDDQNVSISKHMDEEEKAKEVGMLLDQSLYLEQPEKSMNFVLLSWERDFYEHICEVREEFEEREMELIKMLAGDWRKKFNKKGVIFFFFIIEWCAYVKSTLVVKSISWSKIPGYRVGLIRSSKTTSSM